MFQELYSNELRWKLALISNTDESITLRTQLSTFLEEVGKYLAGLINLIDLCFLSLQ